MLATAEKIITAVYTADYKRAAITWYMDDTAKADTMGEIEDSELEALVAAGGSDVPGWACELKF